MSLSSAKAKLDAQGGDPVTGYISKTDHQESYDELVDDTALTGATTAEALDVTGALTAGTIASDATVAGTGLAGGLLSAATPVINGVAAPGTSAIPSRQDHVHAIDTTRAPLASPTFTGTVTIPSGLVLGTVTHTEGTGSPQSVVTAPVGSTYIDTAATTGAIRWIKASGTGNTGWVVEYGDTGLRDVTSLLTGAHTTLNPNAIMTMRRIGPTVTITYSNGASPTATGLQTLTNSIPVGFQHTSAASGRTPTGIMIVSTSGAGSTVSFYMGSSAILSSGIHVSGTRVQGSISFTTDDAWPSSLPGSAA